MTPDEIDLILEHVAPLVDDAIEETLQGWRRRYGDDRIDSHLQQWLGAALNASRACVLADVRDPLGCEGAGRHRLH